MNTTEELELQFMLMTEEKSRGQSISSLFYN